MGGSLMAAAQLSVRFPQRRPADRDPFHLPDLPTWSPRHVRHPAPAPVDAEPRESLAGDFQLFSSPVSDRDTHDLVSRLAGAGLAAQSYCDVERSTIATPRDSPGL